MTFFDFFESVCSFFGPAGVVFIGVVSFLIGFGIYKFVKDWLPW